MIDLKSPDPRAIRIALAVILGITMWRVLWLALSGVELYVDEAQYWLWGQELAFGYFSKPPLVGWVIRGMNELSGSDAVFWIRVASPILYGITALFVLWAARQIWPDEAAAWAAGAFATLPGVSVLSLYISTDAVLLPFYALGLLAMLKLTRGASVLWAILLGIAVGGGFMAKYAMIYFIVLSGLTLVLFASVIVIRRDLIIAGVMAFLIVLPNIIWNGLNGFTTLTHTAGNAEWRGIQLRWDWLAEFLVPQLVIFGPIFWGVFLWLVLRPTKYIFRPANWILVMLSLPILIGVSVQALIGEANANWAAPAYIGATVLSVPWLALLGRWWLYIGAGFNLFLTMLIPIFGAFPDLAQVGGRGLFERSVGIRALSEEVIRLAKAQDQSTIISNDRRVLADLTYLAKGTGLIVLAVPPKGAPSNHYQLTRPAPVDISEGVLVTGRDLPDGCAADKLSDWAPGEGAFRKRGVAIYALNGPCFDDTAE